ncbi:MAG: site-2 protease family protein [Candidatus Aminicenantes bacterium]|nr:site-2 protease family protein [Candidatus Aminicenantes bacterium]
MSIQQGIIYIVVLMFAITIHESAHGWAAYKKGDPTAYSLGRITLNPIPHIDPIGTIALPLLLVIMGAPPFGWAKPVPVNPMNLKDPRKDNLIISAAGPLANIGFAFIAIIILKLFKAVVLGMTTASPAGANIISGIYMVLYSLVIVNVILAVFNLLPIPPLDGSGILMGFLSPENARKYEMIQPYGFFILIILIMTGLIGRLIGFVLHILYLII